MPEQHRHLANKCEDIVNLQPDAGTVSPRAQLVLVRNILRKLDTREIYMCAPHLETVAARAWEARKGYFSTIFNISLD